ncbi:MAG: alpha-glucosidase, partial [Clostridia bacterium]|nr:alpha-glucosidase [Clostridia bacterium]
SDVGGYTSLMNMRRSKEVYLRWCEMNAFCPLMRGHEGLNPDINVQFDHDEDTLRIGALYSRIHLALKPYLKEAVAFNTKCGVGVVRPMFFYYDEREAYTNGYEYLLGRDILVAPVLRPRATTRRVFLPQDEWVDIWTGETLYGGHHEVPAPLDRIPVFVRKSNPDLLHVLEQALK